MTEPSELTTQEIDAIIAEAQSLDPHLTGTQVLILIKALIDSEFAVVKMAWVKSVCPGIDWSEIQPAVGRPN